MKQNIKDNQTKYERSENGKSNRKKWNAKNNKKYNQMTKKRLLMSRTYEDEFMIFINKSHAAIYNRMVTLWKNTQIEIGRTNGFFNGSWKLRNFGYAKQYFNDGGTYEDLKILCEWFKADEKEHGAKDSIKDNVFHIKGLINWAAAAGTFIRKQKNLKIQRARNKKENEKYEKRRQKSAKQYSQNNKHKQNNDFGGYNG